MNCTAKDTKPKSTSHTDKHVHEASETMYEAITWKRKMNRQRKTFKEKNVFNLHSFKTYMIQFTGRDALYLQIVEEVMFFFMP